MKVEIWTDIRFLMINKAITPGEITELIRMQMNIDNDLDRWIEGIRKKLYPPEQVRLAGFYYLNKR